MGTRHLSLLEQKKMQWAKEREELARLSAPWGTAENAKPLRKRIEPNLLEEPERDPQSRTYGHSISPSVKDSPIEDNSINVTYVSPDDRGRSFHRSNHEGDLRSPSLPPVNMNVVEDPRRRVYYRGKEMVGVRPEMYEGYLYINDNQNISKSAENFSSNESDHHAKHKAYLSGDHLRDSSSVEKFPAEISPYSSSFHLRNSNLSIATEGDSTWREWSSSRGLGDEPRPRWGDRGINVGPHWNSGGPHAMSRSGDNLAPPESYPAPGWVERGLSRMSGDGRGRGGSAEYQRCDPGIRVVISDDTGGVQRIRGSMNELQNAGYAPTGGIHETSSQRNYDRHPGSVPYTGEMPGIHGSIGTPQTTGGRTDGNQVESVISVGHDVYNINEVSRNGRQYGCISAPNKSSANYNFKKNDDVTSSLPNLQCTNSHLRGQNVPVDPEVIVERELRRLKAMELQKAIRQQLEEREKKRILEKEQRLKEEKALEERSRKIQEEERKRKEEEEKKHREKEELERKKEEIMREALEAAEQEAQKQRKKRSLRQHEGNVNEEDLNKIQSEINFLKPDDHLSNYTTSPCPTAVEGSVITQPVQNTLDHVDYGLSPSYAPDGELTSRSRSPSVYEGAMAYHPSAAPIAPFKITLPDPTAGVNHDERESNDQRQGGVLIVGRDVYLLPYVNTEVLAPKLMNGSAYSFGPFGGFENVGRLFNENRDYRREWIGGSAQIKSTKDVATQTDPCSQGPLLLLLRMAESEGDQNGYELRSSTDDSSIPECDCKESMERGCHPDYGECYSDCHFCHRMHSESQPTSTKASGADVPNKSQQQADQRPKWGANRPSCKYTTQSEKDPHYSNRSGSQKRSVQGKNKRDTSEVADEISESHDQSAKSNSKSRSKSEHSGGNSNIPRGSGTSRSPTPRSKRHTGKKTTEKAAESKKSDHQKGAQQSQPPLPALAPPKKDTPRRVQIVKPSLSLDQDSNGYVEHLYPDPSGSRTQLTFLPTTQLSPSALQSEMKHLFPPVLPVIQQGRLSPIRITQSPMPPVRINSSPLPSSRLSSTPMPPLAASQSPLPSSRQTPVPTSPSPPPQKPPKSNRQCSSPPVPAVLAKIRREQKSPPRQSSFISSAPDIEEKAATSRRESRSGTPSVKPPTPRPSSSNSRPKSESAILLVSPREPRSAVVIKPLSPTDLESKTSALLIPAQNEVPVSPVVNISYPSSSSPGEDAMMVVTLSEDISIGSPSPNPLSSVFEIDDKSSYLLVTPSDDMSLGFDSRSNFSVSRASQVSADLMPEGFWEDFGSSANVLTPYPEANSAMSTMEEHSSITKAEDITLDNHLPDNIVKTDRKSNNINKSKGINSGKITKTSTQAKNEESKERKCKDDAPAFIKLEEDENEVKLDPQESQDEGKDKHTISHDEVSKNQNQLEMGKSEDDLRPIEKNPVIIESNEQKPDDYLKTDSTNLPDIPSTSNVDITDNQGTDEARSKVDLVFKDASVTDSGIHSMIKDDQSKVNELKEEKVEESSPPVEGKEVLSEVDPEVDSESKNNEQVQEQEEKAKVSEEKKDDISEKEVRDEKNDLEKQ